MRVVIFLFFLLVLAAVNIAQAAPACWPKDLQGGTGSPAIAARQPLTTGAVRDQSVQRCALAWTCATPYLREVEVAVFDDCSTSSLATLRADALTALSQARSTPPWADYVLGKCDVSEDSAEQTLCSQARQAAIGDPGAVPVPAYAASAPTLYDSAGAVVKALRTVTGSPCDCSTSGRRKIVAGELRCELADKLAPEDVFAACDKK